MQTIRVETPSARYDVIAGSGLIRTLAPRIERVAGRLPRRVFVLTSPEIWALWGQDFLCLFCGGADRAVSCPRRKAQNLCQRGEASPADGPRGRRSRIAADRLWRRHCGRRRRVCGRGVHARHSVCPGPNDVSGAGGFVGGRQDRREPARRQEPGRQLSSSAGGVCRYRGAGHAARPRVARRPDGEHQGRHHPRPHAGALHGRARGRDCCGATRRHWKK